MSISSVQKPCRCLVKIVQKWAETVFESSMLSRRAKSLNGIQRRTSAQKKKTITKVTRLDPSAPRNQRTVPSVNEWMLLAWRMRKWPRSARSLDLSTVNAPVMTKPILNQLVVPNQQTKLNHHFNALKRPKAATCVTKLIPDVSKKTKL